ncbi:MAG: SpoIIE family protein phosphatase, partial [Betaproteobacteria bacterium]
VLTGEGVSIQDLGDSTIEVTLADLKFPAQDDGFIWLRQSKHDDLRFVSAIDVIRGNVIRDRLENKIILVGITGLGLFDFKTTALRQAIPGVEIHAQLIEQLMAGEHLRRPAKAMAIELALMILSGVLLIWLVPKVRVHFALLTFLAISISLAGIGLGAFHWGNLLIDVAWPAISASVVLVVILAGSLAVSDQHRRVMGEQAARIGGELKAAQRIQMGLLPDPAKVFGSEPRFTVAAKLEPARRVGGDFYDCFMIDANRLFFVIADVSGKGLAAALFMASAKSHIKSAMLLNRQDVSTALTEAQTELARENPEQMFVTVFAAVLDVTSGKLDYVNAGHDAPFMRLPGQPVKRLQPAAGPPLCVMDDFAYVGETYQLAAGEWLFTMTDGVTEGTNSKGEFYGFDRLEGVLNETDPAFSPGELVDTVMARVHTFAQGSEPADDITLLAVRWS